MGKIDQKSKQTIILLILCIACTLLFNEDAWSCPLIGGLVDFNCDGQHKVVVVGDSVVKGIGDLVNKNSGGYVLRLQNKFKKSVFVNLGKAGFTTDRLISEFKSKINKTHDNSVKRALAGADIIIIDAGRNDFFYANDPPTTVKNLSRLAGLFAAFSQLRNEATQPLIKIATLLPTTRGFQRPFVEEVNRLLLEFKSDMLPVGLYFNELSWKTISVDGIHPFSKGYTVIAKYVSAALKGSFKSESLSLRSDSDNDGIYDIFERDQFNTNPQDRDSDNDSLEDGEEVFKYQTDPRSADSDQDGISDAVEIAAGTDPNTNNLH